MLTRKPLTITVTATHHRWDGLAGSRSPPVRGPGCGRAVVSGRAMVAAYPWGNPRTRALMMFCRCMRYFSIHELVSPSLARRIPSRLSLCYCTRLLVLVTNWRGCCLGETVVHQIGGTGSTADQPPAYHPVVGVFHDFVRVRRGFHVAQTGEVKVVWSQSAILGKGSRIARIVDQIVQIAALVGIQHIHGFAHGPVNGREGRFIHVVTGIFGAQVVPLTEGLATQFFPQGNPGFHHQTGVNLTVPHRLKPLLR